MKKELVETLEKARRIICSMKLAMVVHPDCTEGSEFDDYTTTAQEVEDEIDAVLANVHGKEVNG